MYFTMCELLLNKILNYKIFKSVIAKASVLCIICKFTFFLY